MDLRNHINLIENHGYDGYIAIYRGPDQLSIQNEKVVLVQNEKIPEEPNASISPDSIEWLKQHRTVEYPHSEE